MLVLFEPCEALSVDGVLLASSTTRCAVGVASFALGQILRSHEMQRVVGFLGGPGAVRGVALKLWSGHELCVGPH